MHKIGVDYIVRARCRVTEFERPVKQTSQQEMGVAARAEEISTVHAKLILQKGMTHYFG